jgi:hypothetical protein
MKLSRKGSFFYSERRPRFAGKQGKGRPGRDDIPAEEAVLSARKKGFALRKKVIARGNFALHIIFISTFARF